MPREKKKPDLSPESVGINPYSDNLQIYAIKREHRVLNKFDEPDIKETEFEATPYTKVFEVEAARKQVCALPLRSKELYLDLIHALKSGQDCVWIDREDYMERMQMNSVNTYKSALKGLFDNAYIQKHSTIKDVYWINPHYFFKGSRLKKYPSKILIKKPKKDEPKSV